MWFDGLVGDNRLSSSSYSLSIYSRKTMDDVWKDISLNNHKERHNKSRKEMEAEESCSRKMMLQEFLARPFAEHQQRLSMVSERHTEMGITPFSSACHSGPATVLSLNSGSDRFNYLGSIGMVPNISPRSQPLHGCSGGVSTVLQPFVVPSPPINTFEAVGSSFCKKRVPENLDNTGDRKHKRMIKNRESAARSRARKQAYTNELEQEVAHLIEENARLRELHQKLLLATSAPAPKKSKLQRSSTAPF